MKKNAGFTLIEILISMTIFVMLLGLITLNLTGVQTQTSLNSVVETLVADLSGQQIKAMVGDTEGRAVSDNYGIHFDTTSYTLFHGTYSATEPSNFSITLPDIFQFDPSSRTEFLFTQLSGDVNQFASSTNQIVIQNVTNGETKTITINRYGVITSID